MELKELITEMQANGLVNIRRFKLQGKMDAIANMTKVLATTRSHKPPNDKTMQEWRN